MNDGRTGAGDDGKEVNRGEQRSSVQCIMMINIFLLLLTIFYLLLHRTFLKVEVKTSRVKRVKGNLFVDELVI